MKLGMLYQKYPNRICIVRVVAWDNETGVASDYELVGTIGGVSELTDVLMGYDDDVCAISTYDDETEQLPPNMLARFFRNYFKGGSNAN